MTSFQKEKTENNTRVSHLYAVNIVIEHLYTIGLKWPTTKKISNVVGFIELKKKKKISFPKLTLLNI